MGLINFAWAVSCLFICLPKALSAGAHKNHAGVFFGMTSSSGHTDFSLGVDYERLLTKGVGVALLADQTFAADSITVIAAGPVVHPWKALKIVMAPGMEFAHGTSHFLARAGLGYDFHVGHYSVGPVFSMDWVNQHMAYVYGVAVGRGF